jgi:hypothetical protein
MIRAPPSTIRDLIPRLERFWRTAVTGSTVAMTLSCGRMWGREGNKTCVKEEVRSAAGMGGRRREVERKR